MLALNERLLDQVIVESEQIKTVFDELPAAEAFDCAAYRPDLVCMPCDDAISLIASGKLGNDTLYCFTCKQYNYPRFRPEDIARPQSPTSFESHVLRHSNLSGSLRGLLLSTAYQGTLYIVRGDRSNNYKKYNEPVPFKSVMFPNMSLTDVCGLSAHILKAAHWCVKNNITKLCVVETANVSTNEGIHNLNIHALSLAKNNQLPAHLSMVYVCPPDVLRNRRTKPIGIQCWLPPGYGTEDCQLCMENHNQDLAGRALCSPPSPSSYARAVNAPLVDSSISLSILGEAARMAAEGPPLSLQQAISNAEPQIYQSPDVPGPKAMRDIAPRPARTKIAIKNSKNRSPALGSGSKSDVAEKVSRSATFRDHSIKRRRTDGAGIVVAPNPQVVATSAPARAQPKDSRRQAQRYSRDLRANKRGTTADGDQADRREPLSSDSMSVDVGPTSSQQILLLDCHVGNPNGKLNVFKQAGDNGVPKNGINIHGNQFRLGSIDDMYMNESHQLSEIFGPMLEFQMRILRVRRVIFRTIAISSTKDLLVKTVNENIQQAIDRGAWLMILIIWKPSPQTKGLLVIDTSQNGGFYLLDPTNDHGKAMHFGVYNEVKESLKMYPRFTDFIALCKKKSNDSVWLKPMPQIKDPRNHFVALCAVANLIMVKAQDHNTRNCGPGGRAFFYFLRKAFKEEDLKTFVKEVRDTASGLYIHPDEDILARGETSSSGSSSTASLCEDPIGQGPPAIEGSSTDSLSERLLCEQRIMFRTNSGVRHLRLFLSTIALRPCSQDVSERPQEI